MGVIGRIHPEIIKEQVYVLEINLSKLLNKKVSKMKFKDISIYPTINKDIAVILDKNVTADEISKVIKKAGGNLLVKHEMFDLYENPIMMGKKSVAYSLTFGSNNKTLTDEEVNPVVEKIIESLEKTFKAELRK